MASGFKAGKPNQTRVKGGKNASRQTKTNPPGRMGGGKYKVHPTM